MRTFEGNIKDYSSFTAYATAYREYRESLTDEELREEKLEQEQKAQKEELERKIKYKEMLRENKKIESGLKKNQWFNTFETFKATDKTQVEAVKVVKKFIEEFPDVQRGIMLYGLPGVGKDHLMHAMIQDLFTKDKIFNIKYYFSLDIEKLIKDEWNKMAGKEETTHIEETMLKADLLIISDLHKIFNRKQDSIFNIVYRVINESESTGKPIICGTGNFDIKTYDEVFGDALGSRLSKIMHWHEVKGQDRRREI